MMILSWTMPRDPYRLIVISLIILSIFLATIFIAAFKQKHQFSREISTLKAYLRFCYACFVKPHTGDGTGNQQDALESFYKAQADVYDATRTRLLQGREDMLALVAAQLKYRNEAGLIKQQPVWVDIGGGTGHNVEQMNAFVSVPDFFREVYVVDLSPSLCEIARKRFQRLGWKNVKVICQDARTFRFHEHEPEAHSRKEVVVHGQNIRDLEIENANASGAELITISYALSMIPEFYPIIDSVASLLSTNGIIGVVDFYVQNKVEYQSRNYIGGAIDRHCVWISRVFWRTWFEIDRVTLEPARRDYLEYRFGTVLSVNARNSFFGVKLPYYIWIGCRKDRAALITKLAEIDAAATESPYLSPLDLQAGSTRTIEVHSKAYESAIINLQASLPLPATWYQNLHYRLHYDATHPKHLRFCNTYIYAFTWEDDLADARLLNVTSSDVILAITSAGDNILSFLLSQPRRVHAVDLNPAQNHLLELKIAAFSALGYQDVWKLFGEGRHEGFREILQKLSPWLSSAAFQFWMQNGPSVFESNKNKKGGLYFSGCSGSVLQLVSLVFKVLGLKKEVERLCSASTMEEQIGIWERSLKPVLHSKILTWAVLSNEKWLWKALGVPPAQRDMIVSDYHMRKHHQQNGEDVPAASHPGPEEKRKKGPSSGNAIYEYVLHTFEPIIHTTLLSTSNPYYLLTLLANYTPTCHPTYLSRASYTHLSSSSGSAFNNLRIHTDELSEVLARMCPGTLTIVVVMDSMDWFPREGKGRNKAGKQVRVLNKALVVGGRVLLRSAGVRPWYLRVFEEGGFRCECVGVRRGEGGVCVDRVNMYASTWICTKERDIVEEDGKATVMQSEMGELRIGKRAMEV